MGFSDVTGCTSRKPTGLRSWGIKPLQRTDFSGITSPVSGTRNIKTYMCSGWEGGETRCLLYSLCEHISLSS
jgi:hypothetical protein